METKDDLKPIEAERKPTEGEVSLEDLAQRMRNLEETNKILTQTNQTVIALLVHMDPKLIALLDEPSIDLQKDVVQFDPANFKHIKNPSKDFIAEFVAKNADNIKHVNEKDQDETMQLLAVNQNAKAVRWIKSPTEITLEVVVSKFKTENSFGKFIAELKNEGNEALAVKLIALWKKNKSLVARESA